ncbi:hypothetical protein ACFOSV_05255 [Algoriphagus namhaensis]|uniref:Uncharacterized protein n=1 Tax=Algoriphagus namhaensis TaxID=915353 RepID=A0ABV8ANG2_9BACT
MKHNGLGYAYLLSASDERSERKAAQLTLQVKTKLQIREDFQK